MVDFQLPSLPPVAPPPDPNRYITTTTTDAKATFSQIPAAIPPIPLPGGALLRLGYHLPSSPASIAADTDIATYHTLLDHPPANPIPSDGATAVWYIDTPPGASGPAHRTLSVDVAVQINGETELRLGGNDEDGEVRLLGQGDMAVQRATLHSWRNPSGSSWSRMLVIMAACEPVVVEGNTLGPFP